MLAILSCHPVLSCPVPSYLIASHHITSHHITSHHITSHHTVSHLIISHRKFTGSTIFYLFNFFQQIPSRFREYVTARPSRTFGAPRQYPCKISACTYVLTIVYIEVKCSRFVRDSPIFVFGYGRAYSRPVNEIFPFINQSKHFNTNCSITQRYQPTDGSIGDRLSLCDRSWFKPLRDYSRSDDSAVALADVQNNLSAYLNQKDACDDSSLLGRVSNDFSSCCFMSDILLNSPLLNSI